MPIELVYTIVGGLLALAGGVSTSILVHRLTKREHRRQELLAAYVEWSVRLHDAVEEWKNLRMYDAVEKLKKEQSGFSAISGSPAGRSREELVRAWREGFTRLRAASARLVLLERRSGYTERVRKLSEIAPDPGQLDDVLEYEQAKIAALEEFMRHLSTTHPILSV
jgi:hypothetical protein